MDNDPEVEGEPEEPQAEEPQVVVWDDLTGREKLERFSWAFRKMRSNYNPRWDGKPWR